MPVVDDLLYALAVWLLLAVPTTWFFSRAAQRLRQAPPTRAERLLMADAFSDERRSPEPYGLDAHALWRAIRIYTAA
jgi:hypothetical protein